MLRYSAAEQDEWDKLWVLYLKREPQQLSLQTELQLEKLPRTRDEFLSDPTLFIGCDAQAIENKRVLELGCGCGYLAKRIAAFTTEYVGIDWSGLALMVARHTCPNRCVWIHPSDVKALKAMRSTIDSVVLRHFMIHQDFDHALNVLGFSRHLLKSGGQIFADFWLDDAGQSGRVYDAKTTQTSRPKSATYRYGNDEIDELAVRVRLRVADRLDWPGSQPRRFVTFVRD
ncbi:MAG: class I SAM-dependent methyltransferase [Actinomycetota bacterium]